MGDQATIEIACDAAFAWTLLADPRLAGEWVTGVAEAEVVTHDGDGRALRVRFTGMPSVGSTTYEVEYRYDESARTLRWHTVDGERPIEGSARIEPLPSGHCQLHYEFRARTPGSLPRWARDTLADDTPTRVVAAFQRFVERRRAASGRGTDG